MKRTTHWMMALSLMLSICAMPAFAQTEGAANEGDLKAEIAELKTEIAGMRADMQKLLIEMQAMKRSQAAAAKPAARPSRQRPAQQLLGKPAPEVSFKTTANEDKSLGGKSDKVKVAIFYASWCGFCKRALPGFEKLSKKYADKDVEIMAINLDSRDGKRGRNEQQVLDHFKELGMSLPMHMDPSKEIGNKYKVSSFPTSFVVGKDGVIEAVHIGGPTDLDQQIAGEVDKLLAGESLVKKS